MSKPRNARENIEKKSTGGGAIVTENFFTFGVERKTTTTEDGTEKAESGKKFTGGELGRAKKGGQGKVELNHEHVRTAQVGSGGRGDEGQKRSEQRGKGGGRRGCRRGGGGGRGKRG